MKNKNKKLIIGGAIFFILLAFCTTLFLFNRKKDKQSLVNNLPQLEDVNTEENTNDNTSTEEKNTENKTNEDELADNTTSKNEPTEDKNTKNNPSSDKKDENKPANKPTVDTPNGNKPTGGGSSNSNPGTSKPPTKPSKPTYAGLKIGEVPALLKSLGYEYTPRLILYHISEIREDGLPSTKASAQVVEDGEHMQLVNLKFMVNTPEMLNIIQTLLNKIVPSGAGKLFNIITNNEYISTQIYKYDGKTVRIHTNGEVLDIDIDYLGNYVN